MPSRPPELAWRAASQACVAAAIAAVSVIVALIGLSELALRSPAAR